MMGIGVWANVITKFSRIHRFPIFFTYGALLASGSSDTNLHLYHEARSGHVGLLVLLCLSTWRVMQSKHKGVACLEQSPFKFLVVMRTSVTATDHELPPPTRPGAFKTFFFVLILECLQAKCEAPSLNKLQKRWIIHTKFKTCFK